MQAVEEMTRSSYNRYESCESQTPYKSWNIIESHTATCMTVFIYLIIISTVMMLKNRSTYVARKLQLGIYQDIILDMYFFV